MEKTKVEVKTLRRLAPGRFGEDMLHALSADLNFNDFSVTVAKVELGDDPITERLDVTFFVEVPDKGTGERNRKKRPKLFFTFTSDLSVADNLAEFKDFVREHAATAATAPHPLRGAHSSGRAGD